MSNQERGGSADLPDHGFDSVLDQLLLIRRDFARLSMYIGDPHVLSMNGFILGYLVCQSTRGHLDERYVRFRDWLREVKEEITSEGWETRFLRDCDNDHLRAIRKLLDLVAEFHAMEQRGTC
jgi:hypothetical protein